MGASGRRKRRNWVPLLALLPFSFALLGIAAWGIFLRPVRLAGAEAKAIEQQRLRDAGFPGAQAELPEWYALPPDAPNAAPLYQQAWETFDTLEAFPDEVVERIPIAGRLELPPGQKLSAEQTAAVEDYLARVAPVLALVREAAAIPQCRFPLDFAAGYDMELKHLARQRQFGRLLLLEALQGAHRGQTADATANILTIRGLAESVRHEPVVISQLVWNAIVSYIADGINETLWHAAFSEEEWRVLLEAVDSLDRGDYTRRLLAADAVFMEVTIDEPAARETVTHVDSTPSLRRSVEKMSKDALFNFTRATGAMEAIHATYLSAANDMMALSDLPWPEARKGWEDWQQWRDDLSGQEKLVLEPLIGITRYGDLGQRLDTLKRLVKLAAATEHYIRDHGATPPTEEALVPQYIPAIPDDPYTDAAMQYTRLESGYRWHGVGMNKIDDGGASHTPGFTHDNQGDFIFEVQRPGL